MIVNEVFDAAVRSFAELEFEIELEGSVGFFGDDVTCFGTGFDCELAVANVPVVRGKWIDALYRLPGAGVATVEEKTPTLLLLGFAERIRGDVTNVDASIGRELR